MSGGASKLGPLWSPAPNARPSALALIAGILLSLVVGPALAELPDLGTPDPEDSEEEVETGWSTEFFGRRLHIGAEIETEVRHRRAGSREKRHRIGENQNELSFQITYEPTEQVTLFAEAKMGVEAERSLQGFRSDTYLERGEMWLRFENLLDTGVTLSFGRMETQDERTWWWDEDLEIASLGWVSERFSWDLSLGTQIARTATHELYFDPAKRGVWHGIARAGWQWRRGHRVEFLALHSRDFSRTEGVGQVVDFEKEDELDSRLTWLSFRWLGSLRGTGAHEVDYWLDLAGLVGRERVLDYEEFERGTLVVEDHNRHRVRGYAFDVGATWKPPLRLAPRLTVGWAHGSGGRNRYRQSGLQRNSTDFGGDHEFLYYGELFDPELSNLHVLTVGAGVPIGRSTSLDLLLHQYWQAVASDQLADSGLELSPNGRSRDLGQEADLVFGFTRGRVEAKLSGSVFRTGPAVHFAHRRWNWGMGVELLYAF